MAGHLTVVLAVFLFHFTSSEFYVEDFWIKDSDGRSMIFHGFNAVQKSPPWYPAHLLNDTQLDFYKTWGFNAIRLGIMWAGVVPEDGKVNATYIDIMKAIIEKLEQRNIYVILDMHQDVMSSEFQMYDGIPRWLIMDKLPSPQHPFPWPIPRFPNSSWPLGYLSQACGVAFQGLYNNTAGALNDFVFFWRTVSLSFKSYSNVLGYELINEPWAGDIYNDPSLLLPANAGKKNLQHIYDRLVSEIRLIDNETLIFYEPVTWGIYLNGNYMGTGFTSVPGGSEYESKSVFSYHYYCWFLNPPTYKNINSRTNFTREFCDDVIGANVFKVVKDEVRNLGGGLFLTEFGLCEPDSDPESEGTIECEFVLQQADYHLQSWTYWDAQFFDHHGNVRWSVVNPFSRPFPIATAGRPLSLDFTLETGEFRFIYMSDNRIALPTRIFIPKLHYPRGFHAIVAPENKARWTFDQRESIMEIPHHCNVTESEIIVIVTPVQ